MRYRRIYQSAAVLALLYTPICLAAPEAFEDSLMNFNKSLRKLYDRLPRCKEESGGEVCATAEQIKAQLDKMIAAHFQPDADVQTAAYEKLLDQLKKTFKDSVDIPFYAAALPRAHLEAFYESVHDKPLSEALKVMGYKTIDELLYFVDSAFDVYVENMEASTLKDDPEAKLLKENIFNWLCNQIYAAEALAVMRFYLNGFDKDGYLIGFKPLDRQSRRPYMKEDIDFYRDLLDVVKKVLGGDDAQVKRYEEWLPVLTLAQAKSPSKEPFTYKKVPAEITLATLEDVLGYDAGLYTQNKELWLSSGLRRKDTAKLLLEIYREENNLNFALAKFIIELQKPG